MLTDHKPLRSSARLEQDYNFTVKYQPGSSNPSDFLSRHPLPTTCSTDGQIEECINYIVQNAVPWAINLDDLRESTAEDATLTKLCTIIQCNTWDTIKHPELYCQLIVMSKN